MKRLSFLATTLAAALAFTSPAQAAPSYDTFGTLAGATFGGTGIPNDAVAISTYTNGPLSATLGLTAFGRFGVINVTNDAAGTYFAQTGTFDPPGASPNGALWNFGYYLSTNTASFANYSARLSYDVDPSAGTDFGVINVAPLSSSNTVQDSQNLLFGFLYTSIPGLITPPAGSFDPNSPGTYSFKLELLDGTSIVKTTSIDVVVAPIPEPSTYALLAAGLAVFGVMARRRART
jgi:hypothetical protein